MVTRLEPEPSSVMEVMLPRALRPKVDVSEKPDTVSLSGLAGLGSMVTDCISPELGSYVRFTV